MRTNKIYFSTLPKKGYNQCHHNFLLRSIVCTALCLVVLHSKLKAQLKTGSLSQNMTVAPLSVLNANMRVNYDTASPWVYWYWKDASVSKEGILDDLIAMKAQGIGGAYLMCIYGKPDSLGLEPSIVQLSQQWWQMLQFAFKAADSLGVKIAMHVGDGFAVAGGPWITPALSMQKVIWCDSTIQGGGGVDIKLPLPKGIERGYYKDIAVYAFPAPEGEGTNSVSVNATVTSNADVPDQDPALLNDTANTKTFSSKEKCWITYAFKRPFTCRSIEIRTKVVNHQAKRLSLWISDDGKSFSHYTDLRPSRSGWQDYESPVTYSVRAVTARYFRFVYDPAGTEPGSEDLDDAKWSARLKLTGIFLNSAARISQFEGKSAAIWRIAKRTDDKILPDAACIDPQKMLLLSKYVDGHGRLHWEAPAGNWTILRMGHTSTGMENATAGGGKGLECDKFNPEAVKLQFNEWFGRIYEKMGSSLSDSVLKIFHVDSWECGSQNWSPVFRRAFIAKRGYDPLLWLPAMAGYPLGSAKSSEGFLYDIRLTISELLNENFFGTLASLAHEKGCLFSAEATAPVMVGDGMLHFNKVDIPMGEFWLRSPTHDKPNDIRDAISGGHVYGKQIIQAEAFTELRNKWDEYPGMLKTLQDHHYAMGINRLVFHVFMQNPWRDHKPGMTLNGIGLYFQRDQTWWPMANAWMAYTRRCQAILQTGVPVSDIAVYTGEEIPRRSVLPDRLVPTLPGLFGQRRVNQEAKRLANKGNPMQHIPEKVSSSAGITTAQDWIDPLHGYKYDGINTDALLRLATVENGRILMPGGASYGILVLPALDKMDPNHDLMSLPLAEKILKLVRSGATLLVDRYPRALPGLSSHDEQRQLRAVMDTLLGTGANAAHHPVSSSVRKIGKGKVVFGPYRQKDFKGLQLPPDFLATGSDGKRVKGIAWNHRSIQTDGNAGVLSGIQHVRDYYFVSNQLDHAQEVNLMLRTANATPILYDAVTDKVLSIDKWSSGAKGTKVNLWLPACGSVFVLLQQGSTKGMLSSQVMHDQESSHVGKQGLGPVLQRLSGRWRVQFDTAFGGPQSPVEFPGLIDWRELPDSGIRFYAGIACYRKDFSWVEGAKSKGGDSKLQFWLDLGSVHNIASVSLNGIDCGVAWTSPYRVNVTDALKKGENHLEIKVANTWANRIEGDHELPESKRRTWTTSPFNLDGHALLPAGLMGPVNIMAENVDEPPGLE